MTIARSWAVLLACAVALNGCVSYSPSSAPVPRAADMPILKTAAGVSIGVDPVVQPDRQKAVFDGDLTEAGVLPIQIWLENTGERRVLVRRSDLMLVLPDGQQLSPAGAGMAASRMESIGGVVGATVAFGIIGYLAASNAEEKARTSRQVDFRNKELREGALGKGEVVHGFVFFIPLAGTAAFKQATLMLKVVDIEEGTTAAVSVPLANLNVKGTQESTPERQEPKSAPDPPRKGYYR